MKPLILLGLALVLASCGGDDGVDLSGIYQVTHHTKSETDCNMEGQALEQPLFFQMKKEDLFGTAYFSLNDCTSNQPTSCSSGGLFSGKIFQKPQGAGWAGEMSSSSYSGGNCVLTHQESSALREGTVSLRVETRVWSESMSSSEQECNLEKAEARGKNMPCKSFEVLVGEKSL